MCGGGGSTEKRHPSFYPLVSEGLEEEFWICWEEASAQQPRLSLGAGWVWGGSGVGVGSAAYAETKSFVAK